MSRMPMLDDAIELLTDPANVSQSPDGPDGLAQVATPSIIAGLTRLGADPATARNLAIDALVHLGGENRWRRRRTGLRPDTGEQIVDDFWVPVARLRDP